MINIIKSKKFIRCRENFICAHCGAKVKGKGYTNHCPICLWSKHVDINPGDRQHKCRGLMEPTGLELSSKKGYVILHKCQKCKEVKQNKAAQDDKLETISVF